MVFLLKRWYFVRYTLNMDGKSKQRNADAMKIKEAYKIFGLVQGAGLNEVKKRYRQLMMQVHPDANTAGEYNKHNAQEINHAYAILKKKLSADSEYTFEGEGKSETNKKRHGTWNAPVNVNAYRNREILHYAEDAAGTVLGSFCIAEGKYLWTAEEDFPLFLLSLYHCSKQLLDEIDASSGAKAAPTNRNHVQAELAYLLAQQFIDGTALLKEFAKEEKDGKNEIYYIAAMLEPSNKAVSLETGEMLYPSRIRQHKLYLKNQTGQELGYLSFSDDRLYYIVVPLFEQKRVQVRIQTAERYPGKTKRKADKYQKLHLWLKLCSENTVHMLENLNLQIEQLLMKYKQ